MEWRPPARLLLSLSVSFPFLFFFCPSVESYGCKTRQTGRSRLAGGAGECAVGVFCPSHARSLSAQAAPPASLSAFFLPGHFRLFLLLPPLRLRRLQRALPEPPSSVSPSRLWTGPAEEKKKEERRRTSEVSCRFPVLSLRRLLCLSMGVTRGCWLSVESSLSAQTKTRCTYRHRPGVSTATGSEDERVRHDAHPRTEKEVHGERGSRRTCFLRPIASRLNDPSQTSKQTALTTRDKSPVSRERPRTAIYTRGRVDVYVCLLVQTDL